MRRDAVRRHRVTCDDVAPSLFGVVERRDDVPAEHLAHVEHCLRCQAEVVQHRKVARVLARERSRQVEPPSDLLLGVLAAVAAAGDHRDLWAAIARNRATYVAAAATAATAGAAAGAFVLTRSRRLRLAPAG